VFAIVLFCFIRILLLHGRLSLVQRHLAFYFAGPIPTSRVNGNHFDSASSV